MAIYHARQIAQMSKDDLWNLPDARMKIQFDDGVVDAFTDATILSAYCFGPFYRRYPNCPAKMSHHQGNRQLEGDTIQDLLSTVLFDAHFAYPDEDIEEMYRLATQCNNRIFNDFTYRLEEYVSGLTILDFQEVIDNPTIKAANDSVQPTEASINRTYEIIKDTFATSKELYNNPIAKMARTGLVSMGQILQCVGPRGYCTDTDSNIFKTPVMHGYAHGVQSLAESMIESRSAAKALMFTKDPLQESQYTNRKIQLLAGSLMRLHRTDCGGGRLMPVRLNGGALFFYAGKQYKREEDVHVVGAPFRVLNRHDKHLIGELIYVRTIFDCRHPDPQGVCAGCYGQMALSVPRGTNIGHIAATVMCEAISQILLSTKHLDTSASQEGSILSDYDAGYLEENVETNTIKLSDRLENAKVALIVQTREATRLNDAIIVEDVKMLSPSSISSLTDIKLEITTPKGSEVVPLHVSDEVRKSFMSHDLLNHVKTNGWSLTAQGDIRIDLKEWDHAAPLLELPLKQVNMLDYMFTIERFLRASDKGKKAPTLRAYSSPEAGLMRLYELVTSRLKFNIVHMECLIKACMVRSTANADYRLPLSGNVTEFGRYNDIMAMRSLSAAMAFESQAKVLFSPYAFVVTNRDDHPLDPILGGVGLRYSRQWATM